MEKNIDLPDKITNAHEFADKIMHTVNTITRDYLKVFTSKNHLEQVLRNDDDVAISLFDRNTYANTSHIRIPKGVRDELLKDEIARLTIECAHYEEQLTKIMASMEGIIDVGDE